MKNKLTNLKFFLPVVMWWYDVLGSAGDTEILCKSISTK